ncbi:MAG: ATP-sensitive inward rectifier potassium channel 10 [Verrucomicrobia bacterium]|nr:MAG: ATP-sensitive inward rectifier potassium channel 10 [Verrucomicrobiota bacterium]
MSPSANKKIAVTTASGIQFHKLNTKPWETRDVYHWLLTLRWHQFSAVIFAAYIGINLIFCTCYVLKPHAINGMPPGSWPDAFFFSVETLATVGYGHMYPETTYGHIVATIEIIVGMFGMAIVTGLIFIRFSRPVARILFSRVLVLSPFDGQLALAFRVANLRDQAMAEAEFRLMLMRDEPTKEGPNFRRFYQLPLQFDRLISFPAIITIRHIIDERSPLHGWSIEDLERSDARLAASIVCIDTVIPAPVQTHRAYTWKDIRPNHRFAEVYDSLAADTLTVDYSQLHTTEPISIPPKPD